MKSNINKYREVTELPPGALPVRQFCEQNNWSHQWLYKMIKDGKERGFECVIFQGFNFIIPK